MKKVHLSGIAGTGMSALAGLFKQRGWRVSGSDQNIYPPVDRLLADLGVDIRTGYAAGHVPADVDLCVLGNVLSRGNPEAEHVLNESIPYMSMAEALYHHFIRGRQSVVVAGSHGKTTITSFLAHLMAQSGLKPGFFIGGKPLDFPANFRLGRGDYFVSEGDEYETAFFDRTSKFLKYHPRWLVLSALEYDHIDFFPTEELYAASFANLVNQVPANGAIVCHHDFAMNRRVVNRAFTPVLTYGGEGADFAIRSIVPQRRGYSFTVAHRGQEWPFQTVLDGRYNIWNLTAGIALGTRLGIPLELIARAVSSFHGVERRLRQLATVGEIEFREDFAHHPTAIENVLASLRERDPQRRLVAVFEPRSASLRRSHFQRALTDALALADETVLMEVWLKEKLPAAERLDVEQLADDLRRHGRRATVCADYGTVRVALKNLDPQTPQTVVLFSNGAFGGIPDYVRNGLREEIG
jgi:UDP-N-acetylmuramate: L-alanyl-gamma-D-glutamyl-meso-diaminopimelate ligase